MSDLYTAALAHAEQYARRQGIEIHDHLGAGLDGIVLSTTSRTAIKALRYQALYVRVRDVYRRLQANDVNKIGPFHIPRLIASDDELAIVEIEIVAPPFILDFAGAYLDETPNFPPDVLQAWQREKRRQFGRRWPIVVSAMSELRSYGIFLNDVKPGNVSF